MPGIIIRGKEELIGKLNITNYKDDPRLKLKPGEDMRARNTRWIRSIIWHNTKNIPTKLMPGVGPSTDLDHRIARIWSTDHRNAGAHLSVDWDGAIGCHADLLLDAAYHASVLNEVSIGIELYEDNQGTIYQSQIEAAVALTKYLCKRFSIQMQLQTMDKYYNKVIARILRGGIDCVRVLGIVINMPAKHTIQVTTSFKPLLSLGLKSLILERTKIRLTGQVFRCNLETLAQMESLVLGRLIVSKPEDLSMVSTTG